jgi:inner membrane protein
MEPVTHFLTGACLARAGFNRKTAYATLAMTLAAEAPDLDVLWAIRGPVAAFQHHRGITHTLIAAPFVALVTTVVVWGIHKLRKKKPKIEVRWGLVWLFSLIAALSHLLLDFTNNYGLRPFFPFNDKWYSWDIVFIFEPLMFAALLLALLMPALLGLVNREIGAKQTLFRGRGWAIAALVFVALLYSVRNAEHAHAMTLIRANPFGAEGLRRMAAQPYPVNPFHWYAVVEADTYFQTGFVDTRSDQVMSDPYQDRVFRPPATLASFAARRSWLGQVYLDWAQFPLVEDHGFQPAPDKPPPGAGGSAVEFYDLRFGYSPLFPGRVDASKGRTLSGWVYVGADREIDAMYMGGREQK